MENIPSMLMAEEFNYAYMAGVVDSDGCVSMRSKRRNSPRIPVVEIELTDFDIIDWIHQRFGGTITNHKARSSSCKPTRRWYVTGRAAVEFLHRITPFMRHYLKKQRSQLITSQYIEIAGTKAIKEYLVERRNKLSEQVMSIQMRGVDAST